MTNLVKQRQLKAKERRVEVGRLYLQGRTLQELAEQFGVHHTTIWNDMQIIKKQWSESTISNYDQALAVELRRIDGIEREAWRAWEESKKTFKKRTKRTSGKNSNMETARTEEDRTGNPKYLTIIQRCVDQRMDLLGLKAPTRHQVQQIPYDLMPDHYLIRITDQGEDPFTVYQEWKRNEIRALGEGTVVLTSPGES